MLIRKPVPLTPAPLPERLTNFLELYEKNLHLEVFFIERKDIESLLEMLPAQGELIEAITGLLADLPPLQQTLLRRRLESLDALRASNRAALDRAMDETRSELDQMNTARQRIRQARQLSKSLYQETTRVENWA
jgi:hypothetical protein